VAPNVHPTEKILDGQDPFSVETDFENPNEEE
jgi:hypothetical protein